MGDSSGDASNPSYMKKHSDLNHTFGSVPVGRGKKSKYGRMDDSVLEMTQNYDDSKDDMHEEAQEVQQDDNSERAIWKTTAVHVSYNHAK